MACLQVEILASCAASDGGQSNASKEFAGIDAFPICLASQDTKSIVETVKQIAPVFGGVN